MNNIDKIIKIVDEKIKQDGIFKEIDNLENFYSELILSTFKKFKVSRSDFNGTTGYGYNDIGRDKIDEIFAVILDSEKALVRSQFISGTIKIESSIILQSFKNAALNHITIIESNFNTGILYFAIIHSWCSHT